MRLGVALLAGVLALYGCTSDVWFKPAKEGQHYEPYERSASRVYRAGPECDEIGVVFADGAPGELIEPIAEEAAANGGNKYILRDPTDTESYRTTMVHGKYVSTARTSREVHRFQAAIVYRCN